MTPMNQDDPIPTHADFLNAEMLLNYLHHQRAIHFQLEGHTFDRETMQKHVNERAALIKVRGILLDEGERILNNIPK